MCAIVLYRKRIKGKLYPKAARTGPYAFAQEVKRVRGKVTTKYVGIVRVSEEGEVEDWSEKPDNAERGKSLDNYFGKSTQV